MQVRPPRPRASAAYGSQTNVDMMNLVHGYENTECWAMDWGMGAEQCAGDTKSGTFIAKDNYGNKYYENLAEELPRTYGQTTDL